MINEKPLIINTMQNDKVHKNVAVFQFKALCNLQTNTNLHTLSWNGAVWQCDTHTKAQDIFPQA